MANPSGLPSWIDLATTDLEAAKSFYTKLFGWTAEVSSEPEAGGYTRFQLKGKDVAGVGPAMMEGQPSSWSMYVATDDVDETTSKVEAAGGKVLMPPMDVLDYGKMAVYSDPAGGMFAVWQAGKHGGGEVFNEPNTYTWSELTTRDPRGGKDFYTKVFGWGASDSDYGQTTYTTFERQGKGIAGLMPMEGDMWPANLPTHWMNYFAVADPDATCARLKELGGTVSVGPTDIPVGRFAVVSDPQGAFFSIIRMNQTM